MDDAAHATCSPRWPASTAPGSSRRAATFEFDYRPPHEVDAHAAAGRLDFCVACGRRRRSSCATPSCGCWAGIRRPTRRWRWRRSASCGGRGGWCRPTRCAPGWPRRRCRGGSRSIGRQPTVVLDVAHNVASVAALVESLHESFACERRTLVFAASRDKDVPGMLRVLVPHFRADRRDAVSGESAGRAAGADC